jgi:hypothetical protein
MNAGAARGPSRRGEHVIDRMVENVEHGRFERSLSRLTAFAATGTPRRSLRGTAGVA